MASLDYPWMSSSAPQAQERNHAGVSVPLPATEKVHHAVSFHLLILQANLPALASTQPAGITDAALTCGRNSHWGSLPGALQKRGAGQRPPKKRRFARMIRNRSFKDNPALQGNHTLCSMQSGEDISQGSPQCLLPKHPVSDWIKANPSRWNTECVLELQRRLP